MANIPGLPLTVSETSEADCKSCLALLDELNASITACEQQLTNRAPDEIGPHLDEHHFLSSADDCSAEPMARLHADFCRGLEQRIVEVHQRLIHLVDAAIRATPADDEAAHAMLRHALQDAGATYQEFRRVSAREPGAHG